MWCRCGGRDRMIRIAITVEAFEAIVSTLPLGSVGFENATNERGERLVWLEDAMADRLAAAALRRSEFPGARGAAHGELIRRPLRAALAAFPARSDPLPSIRTTRRWHNDTLDVPWSHTARAHSSEYAEFDLRYRVTIRIDKGQFIIPVVIESGQVDVPTLRNLVENEIRTVTDLIGYLHGSSFDIDIVSALSDEGPAAIFGIAIPVLQQDRPAQIATIESDLLIAVSE